MDENNRRVVLHFDVDAMYVACEREINVELRKVPVAVSQYNPYGDLKETTARDKRLLIENGKIVDEKDANGGLIAVSYEARASGVKRSDRGKEALTKCPSLYIVQVPVKRGKADLTLYRTASTRVMKIVTDSIKKETEEIIITETTEEEREGKKKTTKEIMKLPIEIASIDELYVDVTEACAKMLNLLRQCDGKENTAALQRWERMLDVASKVTTIGGIETQSNFAKAINSLNKDEVRKGSSLQQQQQSSQTTTTTIDEGSFNWWNRPLEQWSEDEIMLGTGAYLAATARLALRSYYGGDDDVFTMSGGIASNKTLAKLASGLKKPNQQTLIDRRNTKALRELFHPLPLDRIRGLGGKLGISIAEKLNVKTLGQLAQISKVELLQKFSSSSDNNTAQFLYDIGRGICHEVVSDRTKPKSITCGKTFRGKLLAMDITQKGDDCDCYDKIKTWTEQLCDELIERANVDRNEYNRIPKLIAVHVRFTETPQVEYHSGPGHTSKSCPAPRSLTSYPTVCYDLVTKLINEQQQKSNTKNKSCYITGITVSASSFFDIAVGSSSITAAFQRGGVTTKSSSSSPKKNNLSKEEKLMLRKKSTTTKKQILDIWLTTTASSTTQRDASYFSQNSSNNSTSSSNNNIISPSNDNDAVTSPSLKEQCNAIQNKKVTTKKPIMDTWLTTSSNNNNAVVSPVASSFKDTMLSLSTRANKESKKRSFFLPKTTKRRRKEENQDNVYEEESSAVNKLLAANKIDPTVWNELPKEYQKSLLEELTTTTTTTTTSRSSVTSYFQKIT